MCTLTVYRPIESRIQRETHAFARSILRSHAGRLKFQEFISSRVMFGPVIIVIIINTTGLTYKRDSTSGPRYSVTVLHNDVPIILGPASLHHVSMHEHNASSVN